MGYKSNIKLNQMQVIINLAVFLANVGSVK